LTLGIKGDKIYAGTDNVGGLYEANLNDLITNIQEIKTENEFSIYPIPVQNNLNIKQGQISMSNIRINISDILGQRVFEG